MAEKEPNQESGSVGPRKPLRSSKPPRRMGEVPRMDNVRGDEFQAVNETRSFGEDPLGGTDDLGLETGMRIRGLDDLDIGLEADDVAARWLRENDPRQAGS